MWKSGLLIILIVLCSYGTNYFNKQAAILSGEINVYKEKINQLVQNKSIMETNQATARKLNARFLSNFNSIKTDMKAHIDKFNIQGSPITKFEGLILSNFVKASRPDELFDFLFYSQKMPIFIKNMNLIFATDPQIVDEICRVKNIQILPNGTPDTNIQGFVLNKTAIL